MSNTCKINNFSKLHEGSHSESDDLYDEELDQNSA